MERRDCWVCWYRNHKLFMGSMPMSAWAAKMEALTSARDISDDVEVVIYRSGRALKDWYFVSAYELRARAAAEFADNDSADLAAIAEMERV